MVLFVVSLTGLTAASAGDAADARAAAASESKAHRFSTLFPADNVRKFLSDEKGIDEALDWCGQTRVTKVYVETFRDGYQAERGTLERAKERFLLAGLDVSGCVTTTEVGKKSTGWNIISCYTDLATQRKLGAIFEYAAGLFDEIMIDDFWFTDCQCGDCDEARRARRVTMADGRVFPVGGDSWADYRCELMLQLSRASVIGAARRVNPRARLIIKYPQWYDRFHERGYDVLRETADFDRIWVGTETRDYQDKRWGGTPQYEAYFIMRWLGGIGSSKCGGGWYDPYGTTEKTYLEQARQTILGGAAESLLFCYGSLRKNTGPDNVAALRAAIPELLDVAAHVGRRKISGVAAYKPANSDAGNEPRVFDFVGMLGIPLVPCHEFPSEAKAAFFSVHAAKDPDLDRKLGLFISSGKPVLMTDGLAQRLAGRVATGASNVRVLNVGGDPKSLLSLPAIELDGLREPLLRPFGCRFEGTGRVGLYLFEDGSWVIENFNDDPATMTLNGDPHVIPARQWQCHWVGEK